ncbi:unnamed protein product [Camellia sinensis]
MVLKIFKDGSKEQERYTRKRSIMAFGGSAVGPPAGAGGPSAIRQVKLDKECELRIEGLNMFLKYKPNKPEVGPDTPLRLQLLTGTAEIFGTEIASEIWLTFPPRLKFTVYTWYGATVEMDGTTETDYTADELYLYKVLMKELAQTLERQFAGNAEFRAAGMVINTMGWIEGVGYELLLHAIDAFNANVVLVLGQEKLCSMLNDVLKNKPNVDVVSRNAKVRQKARSYRIREYFYELVVDHRPHVQPCQLVQSLLPTLHDCNEENYIPCTIGWGIPEQILDHGNFDMNYFGAVGDGSTDDTQSFEDAWKATCSAREVSGFSPTMHVPDGNEFLLQPVIFSGPCNSEAVNVVIDGNLTAPSHPSKWKCGGSNCRQWIGFVEINGLYIYGFGTINAQGTKWWGSSNVNHNEKYHGSKPTGFVIAHSNNVHISDLTFIDSPQMHMALERSIWVYVYNLTISAPGDSPNTDGIHIQHSTHVFISQTHIGTDSYIILSLEAFCYDPSEHEDLELKGDDCISIGDGSSYLNISMITCGPGHGISIGSLGIRGQYETVENVYVSNVEFRGTSNGARIKTWQGGSGFARNIVFEHIRSIGSAHPIIIDQYYCDHTHCKNQKSAVQISNIRYSYIYGTSEEDTAIHFACSETIPCKDIYMNDIYLQSTQLCKETTSLCQNVAGRKNGPVLPNVPCLTD